MFNFCKITILVIIVCLPLVALASTSEQIESAAEAGKVSFVLVTEPGAVRIDQAKQMIQEAMTQTPGSVMIESNRADYADSSFIREHQLATAPVPLILVFASNGAMAGGNVASMLTAKHLVAMVPSPRKAEVLKAIQSGQAAYITASRTGMSSASQVTSTCATACSQLKGKCVALDISMDDPAEADFLKELNVDLQAKEPVTIVFNAQGQLTNTFNGAVEVTDLVKAATQKASSGCNPAGCSPGSSCGPAPKKGGK